MRVQRRRVQRRSAPRWFVRGALAAVLVAGGILAGTLIRGHEAPTPVGDTRSTTTTTKSATRAAVVGCEALGSWTGELAQLPTTTSPTTARWFVRQVHKGWNAISRLETATEYRTLSATGRLFVQETAAAESNGTLGGLKQVTTALEALCRADGFATA